MKIDNFVELIANEFEETAPELFKPETKFKDLEEWDSLVALSIIAIVDEELEIQITGADLKSCNTLSDLFNLVLSKNV